MHTMHCIVIERTSSQLTLYVAHGKSTRVIECSLFNSAPVPPKSWQGPDSGGCQLSYLHRRWRLERRPLAPPLHRLRCSALSSGVRRWRCRCRGPAPKQVDSKQNSLTKMLRGIAFQEFTHGNTCYQTRETYAECQKVCRKRKKTGMNEAREDAR